MKIRCDREKLLAAFQTAAAVAPTRSPKPILQNVKMEVTDSGATLTATDLEIGVRVDVSGVETEAPGEAILHKTRFGSILTESSDETLQIESDGQGTVVKGAHSQFKLSSENPQEFPPVAAFDEAKYFELPARLFKEMIRRTTFATDSESSRYALGGVLLEFGEKKVIAVGTDGRRLAKMEGPCMGVGDPQVGDTMTIVPTKAMQLIERALSDDDAEIQIAPRANDILVKSPRSTIYSRLVEGRFPKWQDVFPRWDAVVNIEFAAGPVLSAVKQAAIVTSEGSRGIDLTFGGGQMVLSSQTAELGQSRVELPIAYDGEEVTIKLDPRYVSDFLRVLGADKNFSLQVKDAENAALLTTEDGYGYVVMPLARDR